MCKHKPNTNHASLLAKTIGSQSVKRENDFTYLSFSYVYIQHHITSIIYYYIGFNQAHPLLKT